MCMHGDESSSLSPAVKLFVNHKHEIPGQISVDGCAIRGAGVHHVFLRVGPDSAAQVVLRVGSIQIQTLHHMVGVFQHFPKISTTCGLTVTAKY